MTRHINEDEQSKEADVVRLWTAGDRAQRLRIHFFAVDLLVACSIDHFTRSAMNVANGPMFIWTLALSSAFI